MFCHVGGIAYALDMDKKPSFGFGPRLKEARTNAGISGAELGVGAGENGRDATRQSVSDWENGRHYPKADQLRIICLKLNVSADHLIHRPATERAFFRLNPSYSVSQRF